MASTLKYWRESASLILASRRLRPPPPKQGVLSKIFGKKDVENVVKENTKTKDEEILRLLMMERSSNASFMPNAYVFPGGMLDKSDFSRDWLSMFQYNTGEELLNLFTFGKPSSPIYSRDRSEENPALPAEMALRVAAIRETFEESGILLARAKSSLESEAEKLVLPNHPLEGQVMDVPDDISKEWREKIMSDSSQFFHFCNELEAVPDIWSLYEWSNWLTPTFRGKRFDTAFFISCIDEAPQAVDDKAEMVHGMWSTPAAMLNGYSKNMVNLSPPQLYELSRLVRFANVDDLVALAFKRAPHRSQRWMAVLMSCQDGLAFLLPGDDLYPKEPDLDGLDRDKIDCNVTFEQLCKAYPKHHRAFLSHEYKQFKLLCNLDYVDGHILPLPFDRLEEEEKIKS